MSEKFVLVEIRGRVGVFTLNRPKQLNALNDQLMMELAAAIDVLKEDGDIGAIVITDSASAFAADGDITAMVSASYMDAYKADFITRNWEQGNRIFMSSPRAVLCEICPT